MNIPEIYAAQWAKAKKSKAVALKMKCLECCCFQKNEVRDCQIETCPLWPHRPYRVRAMTDQRQSRSAEGLKRWREAQKPKQG